MPKKDGIDVFVGQAGASKNGFEVLEYQPGWDAYFPRVVRPVDAIPLNDAREFRKGWITGAEHNGRVVKRVKWIKPELKKELFFERFKQGNATWKDPYEFFPMLFRLSSADRPPIYIVFDGYREGTRTSQLLSPEQWQMLSLSSFDFYVEKNADFSLAVRKQDNDDGCL